MSRLIDLSQLKWQVTPCPPTDLEPVPKNALDATVPGGILLDLERAGLIEDPFYAENFRACEWSDQWTYWYQCQFAVSQFDLKPLGPGEKRSLLFEGIDTFGEVWLNGVSLGKVHNMFRRHQFDVTEILNDSGKNILQVRLDPVIASTRKWCDANHVQCDEKAMAFGIKERIIARKMQMSYGWDNSPHLLTGGIFRPVKLIQHPRCELKDIHWHVEHLDTSAGQASLCVQGFVTSSGRDVMSGMAVQVQGTCRGHQFVGKAKVQADGSWHASIEIDKPCFWWPATLGDPDQYQTEVTLVDPEGQHLDQATLKIGIRTVEIITKPPVKQMVSQVSGHREKIEGLDGGNTGAWTHIPLDPPELRDVYPFHLKVNGVLVFIRGADWQTPDAIPGRVNEPQVKTLLDAAVWANINLIRLWGGGTVEPDYFYEACSERGLLVWQDFYFACAQYPTEQAFLDEVRLEAVDMIKRLRNHTCLACWCGDNESDMIDYDHQIDYTKNPINRGVLRHALSEYDSQKRYYHPSSPSSFPSSDPDPRQSCAGDRRNWGAWHPDNNYEHIRKDMSRVISEGGMYAWPAAETWDKFLPRESQWPPETQTARLHGGDLDFYDRGFLAMTLRACRFFEDAQDIHRLIEVSQFAQGWGYKMLIERCRQRKPECGGLNLWKLNDAWPSIDAGLLDYGLVPRTALQMVRDAYAPVAVSLSEDLEAKGHEAYVWLANDLLKPIDGKLTLEIMTLPDDQASPVVMGLQEVQVRIKANHSACVLTVSAKDFDRDTTVLHARFEAENSEHHSETFYTFSPAVAWRYWQSLHKSNRPSAVLAQ